MPEYCLASRALCFISICIRSADIFLMYRRISLSVENPYRLFTIINHSFYANIIFCLVTIFCRILTHIHISEFLIVNINI